ncbi:DELLA protein RGL1-like protein, partial [Tanacetum coccineum]
IPVVEQEQFEVHDDEVVAVESNHNSTSFVNRFTETLLYRDVVHRAILEGVHFADGMQNIVLAKGEERVSRSVDMNTWRAFFTRFGMVEILLIILGWKGTPLHSLSTWKFLQE